MVNGMRIPKVKPGLPSKVVHLTPTLLQAVRRAGHVVKRDVFLPSNNNFSGPIFIFMNRNESVNS
jgi:hypothetical protein